MATRTRSLVESQPEIEYPDSDGQPMGETGIHVDVILTLLAMLRKYYRGNADVAVLANMFLYYVEGDRSKNVAPDLFVTLNVPANTKRRTFKVWDEGKCPDFVLEVTDQSVEKMVCKLRFWSPRAARRKSSLPRVGRCPERDRHEHLPLAWACLRT